MAIKTSFPMMKKTGLIILTILMLLSTLAYSQDTLSISGSRKKNLKYLLNYRFKGGFYSFEKLFSTNVSYPEEATNNCIVGIVIASFEVDCKGIIKTVSLKNPLHYGIDEQITSFFQKTKGKWNTCEDDKYTRFDVPIQFTLKGTETNSEDALIVYEGKNPGYICNGDEYYFNKAKKYLDKGNGKRAIEYLDILIKRDPFNNEYYDLKKKAISMIKKKH